MITLQRGFDITKKEQICGKYPVISSGGVSSYHNQYKVKGPGIVIGRKGTLGTVFYNEGNFWPHDTSLWVKDFKGNDPKFIYYLLQVLNFEKFDTGAANPTLNRNHVHSLKLEVPKKEYRSKIASILSAYDELIENNMQRIKLLEEMAEEIYKEWFVRLRFPGYQDAKFFDKDGNEVPHGTVGALPEGWEFKKAEEYFDINIGKTPPRKEPQWFTEDEKDIKWVSIKDINASNIFVLDTSEKITRDGAEKFNMRFAPKNTVILSFKLTVGKIGITTESMLTNEAIAHFNIKEKSLNVAFTYWYLRTFQFGELGNTSSIGNAINSKIVKAMPFLLPKGNVLPGFNNLVGPMISQIETLVKKNQVLQETRDLLLPRLISGKLSVEHINLEKTTTMAMAAEPEVEYKTESE